jgi:hypothetical protein
MGILMVRLIGRRVSAGRKVVGSMTGLARSEVLSTKAKRVNRKSSSSTLKIKISWKVIVKVNSPQYTDDFLRPRV